MFTLGLLRGKQTTLINNCILWTWETQAKSCGLIFPKNGPDYNKMVKDKKDSNGMNVLLYSMGCYLDLRDAVSAGQWITCELCLLSC